MGQDERTEDPASKNECGAPGGKGKTKHPRVKPTRGAPCEGQSPRAENRRDEAPEESKTGMQASQPC